MTSPFSRPLKLLHIEDDPAYARLIELSLGRQAASLVDIELAETAADGLRLLSERVFDVVLLDLSLPDSRGLESCERLAEQAGTTPIVILAAQVDDETLERLILSGAEDVLVKGQVDSATIWRTLQFAVERREVRQNTPVLAGNAPREAATGRDRAEELASDADSSKPWRLLQVEDNAADAFLVQETLEAHAAGRFRPFHAERLSTALGALSREVFDLIMVDLSLPDSRGLETCLELRRVAPQTPIVVHTGSDDQSLALRAVQSGASDFLVKGQIEGDLLARALRCAARRKDRRAAPRGDANRPLISNDAALLDRPERRREERRVKERYDVVIKATAIPVGPDGRLDWSHRVDGHTRDLSFHGLGLDLEAPVDFRPAALLVGLERSDGVICWGGLETRLAQRESPTRLRWGGKFGGPAARILEPASLLPRFDPRTLGYAPGASEETLATWVSLGVLRPTLLDRILLCPKCRCVPTFRHGCRSCGSARISEDQLIHHYACAHVGFLEKFQTPQGLVCPKCRRGPLVVGAEFEYQSGPNRCLDCHWSDTSLEQVGQCLRCEFRFPARQAYVLDLIGYHVERLDPLAFIAVP